MALVETEDIKGIKKTFQINGEFDIFTKSRLKTINPEIVKIMGKCEKSCFNCKNNKASSGCNLKEQILKREGKDKPSHFF